MGRSAVNRQGNVVELSGNFTLSGEWSPCVNQFSVNRTSAMNSSISFQSE